MRDKDFDAVIFDMNGIIVLDEELHETAFKTALKKHGMDLTPKDYRRIFAGRTDVEGLQQANKEFSLNLEISEVQKEKSESYDELFDANKYMNPQAVELIRFLNDKYKLAVTSSSLREEVESVLHNSNLYEFFNVVISANDVKKGKPDPEPYDLTAQKLKVANKNCCVIEDSRNGIESAKAAGMYCIAVTTTHLREEMKKADRIVEDLNTIRKLLN